MSSASEAEERAVADFLTSASDRPAGLLLEGDAGIGKTTLWLTAIEQARERRVPSAVGASGRSRVGAGLRAVGRPVSAKSTGHVGGCLPGSATGRRRSHHVALASE